MQYDHPTRPMGNPMDAAVKRITAPDQCYQCRRPEKTLWYRTVQSHFETWLAITDGPGDEAIPAYIEQAFRRYLDCGILAKGFARAHCDECGQDFTWDDNLRNAVNAIKALRHKVISLYVLNTPRDGTPMSQSSFKGCWRTTMIAAMAAGSISERFAETDLRAKVATEAHGLGQNASAMLGHSSDAVTRRHYVRGTQKIAPLGKKY